MSDLKNALNDLAERGAPIGSSRLRERVMLDLAGEASATSRRRFGMARPAFTFVVAAVLMLVMLGSVPLFLRAFSGEGSVTATTVSTIAPPLTSVPPTTALPQRVTTSLGTATTMPIPGFNLRDSGDALDAGWSVIRGAPVTDTIGPLRLENGLWASLWSPGNWSQPLPIPITDTDETFWVSVDGMEWESREVPEFVGRAIYSVEYDASYSMGAEGQLWVRAAPVDETMPSELWITDDGDSWHQVEFDTSVPTQPDGFFRINGISRVDDVLFMTANRSSHFMQLVSTDRGRTFTEIAPFPADGFASAHWSTDRELQAFVTTRTGLVSLWRSSNGLSWELVGAVTLPDHWAEQLYPEFPQVIVNWSPEALIAGLSERRCEASVAVSTDGGLSWELVDVNRELAIEPTPSYCVTGSSQGWFLFQAIDLDGFESGAWVTQDGLDWYSIDGWINTSLGGNRQPASIRTNDYNRYAVPPVE